MNSIWSGRLRHVLAAAVLLLASPLGLHAPDAQAQSWPKVQDSSEAKTVLAAFERGPYGQMAKGRVARQTLVQGIYALVDPAGKFAPIFTDAGIKRMKNGGSEWLDVASGKPLGAAQIRTLRAEMAKSLDLARAISFTYGSGGNDAILVSAYDCPYCKELEKKLDASAVNASVHLFPMALQHSRAAPMATARDIWCSPDAAKAWKARVLAGEAPARAAASCSKDARDTAELMSLFDIKAVPVRIHADGRVSQFRVDDL